MRSTSRAPRDVPIPPHWSVREARDAYLAENGFRLLDYDAPRTPGSFLGIRFSVPNTPAHRRAIMQHDLHHVATGFGTDPAGEGEISAWEARRGLGDLGLYVGGIVVFATLIGAVFAPLRVWQAWRAGASARPLFALNDEEYPALLELSVGELRERLGVPRHGLTRRPRALHSTAPA